MQSETHKHLSAFARRRSATPAQNVLANIRFEHAPDPLILTTEQVATERELDAYCKTREGEAKLSRAASKLREKAIFASQMDGGAARKGVVKMSKADAKAQARLNLKTEIYMQNVQKVSMCLPRQPFCVCSCLFFFHSFRDSKQHLPITS